MTVKTIIEEDFSNYKKPSMLIAMPRCTFKCNVEYCQNSPLAKMPDIEVDDDELIQKYLDNNLTQAIVFGGLEPLDSWDDLIDFIIEFRLISDDDIVIYTGYTKCEVKDKIEILWHFFPNIIVKFGRYVPDQQPHYDEVLGVYLASDNQYAERIC